MITAARVLLFSLLLGGTVGCGDDDDTPAAGDGGSGDDGALADGGGTVTGEAAALVGVWIIETFTVPDEGGDVELTANPADPTIRGHLEFSAGANGDLNMDVTFAGFDMGVLDGLAEDDQMPSLVQDDGTLLIGERDVVVFDWGVEGSTLTLTAQLDDPRSTMESDAPRRIVARRATPEEEALMGEWTVTQATFGGMTVSTGECHPDGDRFQTATMSLTIANTLSATIATSDTEFSDDACTMETGTGTDGNAGFAGLAGDAMYLWLVNVDDPESSAFTMVIDYQLSGDTLEATVTDCLPQPDCTDETPSALTMTRAQ